MCVLYLEPPFCLSQAWGACTFCSSIFCQCTRASPVQTLLFLPLTVYGSLKRWHPGSWFKWFKALSQNWELNSFWWVLCHQLWPQQFALPWPVLKFVKIRDTCIGDHLQHCLFFFFSPFSLVWFSLGFCYIFWDLKVLLNPCTAGVGSCRDQGTVHFFLGQQWLTGHIETLITICLFSLTLEVSSPPLVHSSFLLDLLLQSWWKLRKDWACMEQEQSARKEAYG